MQSYKQIVESAVSDRETDPLDIATNRSQQEIDHRVSQARIRAEEDAAAAADAIKEAKGKCLFCKHPLKLAHARWCDAGCRDDWEAENKAADRNRRGF